MSAAQKERLDKLYPGSISDLWTKPYAALKKGYQTYIGTAQKQFKYITQHPEKIPYEYLIYDPVYATAAYGQRLGRQYYKRQPYRRQYQQTYRNAYNKRTYVPQRTTFPKRPKRLHAPKRPLRPIQRKTRKRAKIRRQSYRVHRYPYKRRKLQRWYKHHTTINYTGRKRKTTYRT